MDLTDWTESALSGRDGLNSRGLRPCSLPAATDVEHAHVLRNSSTVSRASGSSIAGAPLPWPYAHGREIDEPWTYPAAMAVVCLGLLAGVIGVAMAIAYVVPQVAR